MSEVSVTSTSASVGETKQAVRPKKQKKNFETYWKVLLVVISIIMSVLLHKIYLFHSLEEFKDHKKGSIIELGIYTIPFAIIFMAFQYLVHYCLDEWTERNILRTDKYPDIQSRMKKSYSITKWSYSAVYYLGASITAYVLLRSTNFLPHFLGGKGNIYTLQQYRYLEEATVGMQWYYYVQLGKHIGRLFGHLFIKPEGSFWEYTLHHSLSSFLIIFSYTMDMWVIGIFVLFVHDASDIFLGVARGYRQSRNRKQSVLNIFYATAVFLWIVLRIFTFGYCCVYAVWYQCFYETYLLNELERHVFIFPYYFMALMLTCLQMMHIYWTYFIIESFAGQSGVVSKAIRHSYD